MKIKTIRIFLLVFFILAMVGCVSACKPNGDEYSETPHVAHECSKIRAKAATCEKEGNIEYWACYGCDKIFEDEDMSKELSLSDVVIPKLDHTPVKVESEASTCTMQGNVECWCCSECFTYFEEETCQTLIEDKTQILLSTLPHSVYNVPAKNYNGYENGNIEYWCCEDCSGCFSDENGRVSITLESTVVLAPYNTVDFVVEVATGKNPVVLQLTDTQIIDAGQQNNQKLSAEESAFWATDKVKERCYDYITEVVEATNPDLIIITGDVIYGKFDDNGTALLSFINFMESFDIPWAPVFGNHDNESSKGADWQCEQLENAENCLFLQRTLTGNGNYSVAIAQGGQIKRVFYMLDSNGCGGASDESLSNGHTVTTVGFAIDQMQWYNEQIETLKKVVPDVKISFAFHIQLAIFESAYAQYNFNQSVKEQDINIDMLVKEDGNTDFGYIGAQLKNPWDSSNTVYNGLKTLGVDSIFVGHEHCNSASVTYDGILFQFGQKSSEYDRFNRLRTDGSIFVSQSEGPGTSLMGGTVIPLSEEDGAILTPYIYYCGFANGVIDWSQYAN